MGSNANISEIKIFWMKQVIDPELQNLVHDSCGVICLASFSLFLNNRFLIFMTPFMSESPDFSNTFSVDQLLGMCLVQC